MKIIIMRWDPKAFRYRKHSIAVKRVTEVCALSDHRLCKHLPGEDGSIPLRPGILITSVVAAAHGTVQIYCQ